MHAHIIARFTHTQTNDAAYSTFSFCSLVSNNYSHLNLLSLYTLYFLKLLCFTQKFWVRLSSQISINSLVQRGNQSLLALSDRALTSSHQTRKRLHSSLRSTILKMCWFKLSGIQSFIARDSTWEKRMPQLTEKFPINQMFSMEPTEKFPG